MLAGGYCGVLAVAVVALLLVLAPVQSTERAHCDDESVTIFPPNSTFQANVNLLAAALPANASSAPTGFSDLFTGTPPDRVYAMALCRGDTNASSCAACVAAAFRAAPVSCPNRTALTMYEDDCTLRFANRRVLDSLKDDQWQIGELSIQTLPAPFSVPAVAVDRFSTAVTDTLTAVSDHALAALSNLTAANAKKYFATGEVDFDPRIYVLAQCVPLMTPAQCSGCLGRLRGEISSQLSTTAPRWVMSRVEWCYLMYSVRPFYKGQSMLQLAAPLAPIAVPPSGTPKAGSGKKRSFSAAGMSVGITCSLVSILVLSAFAFIHFRRRIKATEHDNPLKKISRAQCTIFDLPELQEATENFSERNKLGEGGFGVVYKGILPNGQEIAVKKLLGRGGHGLHQLHNEVLLLAELQHKNLVRLQGFCSHREDTLLVYEYIKNGSLDNFLSDTTEGQTLIWEQQFNVILGIAKGILYLHEDSSLRIIHRDLKPNNILLDEDMDPKIADFGLARLLGEGHTHTKTSQAVGTLGYMAPEYALHGRVSPKLDIFSYGVLVLQILTRRRNCRSDDINSVNLLSEVWNHWKKGTISQMMDQTFDEHAQIQWLRCVHVGLLCVQPEPGDRPEISSIIFMLTRENMELQPPEEPAFFFGSDQNLASSSYSQSDFVLGENISANGLTITELHPR